MKKNVSVFKIISLSVLMVICKNSSNAQAPYWKLNGNPNFGTDIVTPANNFLGTSAINNIPVRFGTAGIESFRMNNTGNAVTTAAVQTFLIFLF